MITVFFYRHRRRCNFIRAGGNPVPDRTDPDSRRRLCHDLLPGRVVKGRSRTGRVLSANEVFGNLGFAVAARLTSYLIDTVGWRRACFAPGAFSGLIGIGYMLFIRGPAHAGQSRKPSAADSSVDKALPLRVFALVLSKMAIVGLVFQSTIFSLPKTLDERLTDIAGTATMIGWHAFLTFFVAAFVTFFAVFFLPKTRRI